MSVYSIRAFFLSGNAVDLANNISKVAHHGAACLLCHGTKANGCGKGIQLMDMIKCGEIHKTLIHTAPFCRHIANAVEDDIFQHMDLLFWRTPFQIAANNRFLQ
ncbi:MAG: hypothetical protein IJ412_00110 [Oscillospiraceae bacterium]|nr:hypothetical protein [Oscillospiraceae bacterium]